MNSHLHSMFTQRRGVELRRASERARLASEVSDRRRNTRDPAPVTRLRMHPPRRRPTGWSARSRSTSSVDRRRRPE
jgi:hypothetical protein